MNTGKQRLCFPGCWMTKWARAGEGVHVVLLAAACVGELGPTQRQKTSFRHTHAVRESSGARRAQSALAGLLCVEKKLAGEEGMGGGRMPGQGKSDIIFIERKAKKSRRRRWHKTGGREGNMMCVFTRGAREGSAWRRRLGAVVVYCVWGERGPAPCAVRAAKGGAAEACVCESDCVVCDLV